MAVDAATWLLRQGGPGTLTGNLDTLRVDAVVPTDTALVVVVTAAGRVELTLRSMPASEGVR